MLKEVKDRLVAEHADLVSKINKISAFISDLDTFNSLNETNQKLIKRQLNVMLEYQQILIERIKLI